MPAPGMPLILLDAVDPRLTPAEQDRAAALALKTNPGFTIRFLTQILRNAPGGLVEVTGVPVEGLLAVARRHVAER